MDTVRRGDDMQRQRWIKWSVIFGVWTLIALIFASQWVVHYTDLSWKDALTTALIDWWSWALLSPFILLIARRFRISRQSWQRGLAFHVPASILFSILHVALQSAIEQLTVWTPGKPSSFVSSFAHHTTKTFHLNLLTYWGVVGFSHAIGYYWQFHEREISESRLALRTSRLEAQLAQAQLQALKMQLQPHFLFNTLHAISALIRDDPKGADTMLANLSDLLRLSLDHEDEQEIALSQELKFVRKYLEIEQIRFQDRLEVQLKIPAELLDARVPNLLLQPLVENAIRHGVSQKSGMGLIEIEGKRVADKLQIFVRDNGCGIPKDFNNNGIGLANTRQRLDQLYGSSHSFNICNSPGGGVLVSIVIPFRDKGVNFEEK